jgi:hypothetical protein
VDEDNKVGTGVKFCWKELEPSKKSHDLLVKLPIEPWQQILGHVARPNGHLVIELSNPTYSDYRFVLAPESQKSVLDLMSINRASVLRRS